MTRLSFKFAACLLVLCGGVLFFLWGCASQAPVIAAADPEPAAATVSKAKVLRVTAEDSREMSWVTVHADRPLTFSALKQPDPLAVVLYLPETEVGGLSAEQLIGDSAVVSRIIAKDGDRSGTARVEIQLRHDLPYAARKEGNSIRLTFDANAPAAEPRSVAVSSGSIVEEAPIQPVMAESSPQAADIENTTDTAVTKKEIKGTPAPGSAWVNKVDFLSEADGKSTIVIGTSQAVAYTIDKASPRKIELRLLNTRIPAYRQRPLITTRFASAVDRVVPYQPSGKENETVVSVELREAVPYFSEQVDNMLLVHFEASSVPPKPMEQANLPDWQQAMAGEQPPQRQPTAGLSSPSLSSGRPADLAEETPDDGAAAAIRADEASLESQLIEEDIELRAILSPRRKNYTGEKIALDFYDTDIKNVFRILREVSGKNFAIDKDVTGKVTMTLDRPVPWDQVLDLVLRMNQLGMSHEGEIIRVATLETLKNEDDLRKAKLESIRKAREEAKALEPLVTRYFPISYCSADSDVKPHIEKILTAGRGSVTVDAKNNQVIVTDIIAKIKQSEEIVRRIDKVTAQVIIEARIAEVANSFSKELGIAWDFNYGPGIVPGTNWNARTDAAMNFPSQSNSSIGINFSKLSGVPFVLNARLNALETTGEGRILSSPKILTLDNKKAKIKQGLEFPYLERDSSGGASVKFKSIDLLLEVTPHVTPDNRVSLLILITKNDVDAIVAGAPSVATNEAETELLINDGDTVVIGGIIKKTSNDDVAGFPYLSKIPILGWAFKNNTVKTTNRELLIFISPRIVQLEQAVIQSEIN